MFVTYLTIGTFCHSVYSRCTVSLRRITTSILYIWSWYCYKIKSYAHQRKNRTYIHQKSASLPRRYVDGWGFCCVFISIYMLITWVSRRFVSFSSRYSDRTDDDDENDCSSSLYCGANKITAKPPYTVVSQQLNYIFDLCRWKDLRLVMTKRKVRSVKNKL